MSGFCPDACPTADACVVGYPCARHPMTPELAPKDGLIIVGTMHDESCLDWPACRISLPERRRMVGPLAAEAIEDRHLRSAVREAIAHYWNDPAGGKTERSPEDHIEIMTDVVMEAIESPTAHPVTTDLTG